MSKSWSFNWRPVDWLNFKSCGSSVEQVLVLLFRTFMSISNLGDSIFAGCYAIISFVSVEIRILGIIFSGLIAALGGEEIRPSS